MALQLLLYILRYNSNELKNSYGSLLVDFIAVVNVIQNFLMASTEIVFLDFQLKILAWATINPSEPFLKPNLRLLTLMQPHKKSDLNDRYN